MANIALITNNVLSDSGTAITSLVSGSGTTNYLPKFTGSTALGNSIIYDNGTAIGIGTTSPLVALDVRGTAIIVNPGGSNYNENLRLPEATDGYAALTLGGSIAASGTSASQWTLVKFPTSNNFSIRNNSSDYVTVFPSGNFAIGNSTDAGYKLDVVGNTVRIAYSAYAGIEYHNTTGTWEGYIGTENGSGNLRYNSRQGAHTWYYNSTATMTLTSGGNLGIGTTSPAYKLQVAGDIGFTAGANRYIRMASPASSGSANHIVIQAAAANTSGTGGNIYLYEGGGAGGPGPGSIYIGANNGWTTAYVTGRLTVTNSGPNTDTAFQVNAGGQNGLSIYWDNVTPYMGYGLVSGRQSRFYNSSSYSFDNNLLVGTNTNAGYKLDVIGDSRIKGSGSTSGTTTFRVENSSGGSPFTILGDGTVNMGFNANLTYNMSARGYGSNGAYGAVGVYLYSQNYSNAAGTAATIQYTGSPAGVTSNGLVIGGGFALQSATYNALAVNQSYTGLGTNTLIGYLFDPTLDATFPDANIISIKTTKGNVQLATSSGNVGIGTTSPGGKLHVIGAVGNGTKITTSGYSNWGNIVSFNNDSAGGLFGLDIQAYSDVGGNRIINITGNNTTGINFPSGVGVNGWSLYGCYYNSYWQDAILYLRNTTGGTGGFKFTSVVTGVLMSILENGNVLIGTTTDAGYKLQVNGTTRFGDNIYLTGTNRYISTDSSSKSIVIAGGSSALTGAYFHLTGNTFSSGSPGAGSAEFVIRTNSDSKFAMFGYNGSSWSRYMTLFGPTGNLNIGYSTTDLGYKLSIQGDTYNTGQIVSVGNISSYASVLVNGNSEGYDLMVYPDTTSGPNNLYSGGQVKANIYTSSVGTTTIVPSTTQVLMSWYPSTTQAVFIDYVIWIDGPNAMRSGTFTIVNDAAGNVQYNDVSTIDLNASTSSVVLNAANNGGTMEFTAYNSGGNIVYMNIITRYIPTMF